MPKARPRAVRQYSDEFKLTAESFFHTLKAELTRGVHFATERHQRNQLHRYMLYYNTTRLHSALRYLSPIAFEARVA